MKTKKREINVFFNEIDEEIKVDLFEAIRYTKKRVHDMGITYLRDLVNPESSITWRKGSDSIRLKDAISDWEGDKVPIARIKLDPTNPAVLFNGTLFRYKKDGTPTGRMNPKKFNWWSKLLNSEDLIMNILFHHLK